MSPEATAIWLGIAFILFIVGAALSWARPYPTNLFFACLGLAAFTFVPLWTAIRAM
jgi:hypothetical protein